MLTRRLVTAATAGLLAGLLLVGGRPAPAVAARSWASAPTAWTPTPASPTPVGLNCQVAHYDGGFTRVCVSVHYQVDELEQGTVRPAAAIATYGRRGRPVARPLAVRVAFVGRPATLRRAFPLETTRRTRRGGELIGSGTVQARATVMELHDGRWRKYLVYSQPVQIR